MSHLGHEKGEQHNSEIPSDSSRSGSWN